MSTLLGEMSANQVRTVHGFFHVFVHSPGCTTSHRKNLLVDDCFISAEKTGGLCTRLEEVEKDVFITGCDIYFFL
jgi:hypothetical protein